MVGIKSPSDHMYIHGLYDFTETTVLDKSYFQRPQSSNHVRWALSHGLWAFNVKTPSEYLEKASHFGLVGIVIKCPVFIGDANDDHFFKGQPERMEYAIGDNATRVVFMKDGAAGEHCHEVASRFCRQVIFDWFEEKVVETENGDVL
ncbi:hypothetical protein SCAR479_07400 [Seiridium cardinale]|uniref:Uncharacterized protein n=1 Tax=Seiridium cardinale TaxID=138064 RepID=A0ABR2XQ00_9PEZI